MATNRPTLPDGGAALPGAIVVRCGMLLGEEVEMGLLDGRRALVFGVANDHSIAWGVARALHDAGAELGFSSIESLIERRVRPLASSIGADFVEPCDVQDDAQIERVMTLWAERYGQLDVLVHALAFARREDLDGRFVDTSREGFALALDVSAYSLVALARAASPLLRPGSSIITLTYYGSEKVVANYNVMGVAKAALEASVRYLAADLGPQGVRVNAISAGPIRTLAATGIAGFRTLYGKFRDVTPLRRNITIEDVGGAAVYLASDLSSAVTGEVHYVDGGFNVLGVPTGEE
jgi:enoyl-[acyl-carrier protein] reductase I